MTEAQEKAIEKMMDIMREHFDAGLFAVEARDEDTKTDTRQFLWHGGVSTAIGLAIMAKYKIENQKPME